MGGSPVGGVNILNYRGVVKYIRGVGLWVLGVR